MSDDPEAIGYDTIEEALEEVRRQFDADALIELHEEGCDGEDCTCDEVVIVRPGDLVAGGKA